MRESCERMVYNIIIFHLLLKEKIMLFNNMNLFAVFMTSAALSFTSAVFCLSMIAVFEKITRETDLVPFDFSLPFDPYGDKK